jgi:hypothetical protein
VFRNRCAANFYKELHIRPLWLEKCNILSFLREFVTHTHTGSLSIVLFNMCYVLFSYACFLIGQGFICRHIFMAMYSFVHPFREAKFCGVPSCVFDKLGCAAGEKFAEHWCRRYCSFGWLNAKLRMMWETVPQSSAWRDWGKALDILIVCHGVRLCVLRS